jgi:peptidoglycan/xylan/chitin deacetylase (PgdA/CDA1 family)
MHLINGRAGGGILCYHHISSDQLESQLTELSRRHRFVSLDEIVSRLEAGKSTVGLLAITFDDGFAAEVESASALAIRRGWPMTLYLATEFLRSGRPYWFEEIGPLVRAAPSGDYRVGGWCFHLEEQRASQLIRDRIVRHLFYRPASEIDQFMKELRKAFFESDHIPEYLQLPQPIAAERIRELSQHEQITCGAHSVSHVFFSTLSAQQIRQEMEVSKQDVESLVGRSVDHFCYPYGDLTSIGSQAPGIARRIFRSGATVIKGRCRSDADRFLLPRIALFDHDTKAMAQMRVEMTR